MSGQGRCTSIYNELHPEGNLCDAIIKVEDVEFQIHKVVLCNCSPYFRVLFNCCSTEDRKVFHVSNLSPHMMELIIQFAYTGSVMVTEDNVQELLLAADMLNVVDIVQTCSNFLSEKLCPENCVGIWQVTNICLCPELQHRAYSYIMHHFREVVFHEEFLQLSVQELTDILKRDDLGVKNESTVLEAILRWISHLPEEREGHITLLFSKVQLALSSEEYIKNTVMSNKLGTKMARACCGGNDSIQTISHVVINRPSLIASPGLASLMLFCWPLGSGFNPSNDIEVFVLTAGSS